MECVKVIKKPLIVLLCIMFIFLFQSLLYSKGETVIASCSADLDRDGAEETVSLTGSGSGQFGEFLTVRTSDHKLYRYDLEYLRPWKVQAADVDGDGRYEISLGVYKTAEFHPVLAKRPFIYNWDPKGQLVPKWLGSRLSRPFDDYIFCDVDRDGMDELVSIERLSDGEKVIDSYKWKGFGFESIGGSKSFRDIFDLKKQVSKRNGTSKPAAQVREDDTWRFAVFDYEEGRLKELD